MADQLIHNLQNHARNIRAALAASSADNPAMMAIARDLEAAVRELIGLGYETLPTPQQVYADNMERIRRAVKEQK